MALRVHVSEKLQLSRFLFLLLDAGFCYGSASPILNTLGPRSAVTGHVTRRQLPGMTKLVRLPFHTGLWKPKRRLRYQLKLGELLSIELLGGSPTLRGTAQALPDIFFSLEIGIFFSSPPNRLHVLHHEECFVRRQPSPTQPSCLCPLRGGNWALISHRQP